MTSLGGAALTKRYGDSEVVRHVDIDVHPTEVVGLLGPNGAGKTTLVNLISGHLFPDSGRVTLGDKDITHASPYRRIKMGIARNFQITQLFEELTVLDNVRNCVFSDRNQLLRLFKPAVAYHQATAEAMDILELFQLTPVAGEPASELSEGDKKILDTAMAFALKSRFLLLDEPTSGVATAEKFKVMDTIVSAIRKQGMACMIIEHDMDIVSDYSDRVLVLSEGEIIAQGAPNDVMEQANVREILFGVRT